MFFGGGGFGGGHRHRGPRRTKNLMHQLSVSLEEMYKGTTRKLALQKNVICSDCDGEALYWQNISRPLDESSLLQVSVARRALSRSVPIAVVPVCMSASSSSDLA